MAATHKVKSHKGVLKRVKVTARGKVRFGKTRKSHLMSHMSGDKVRRLRQPSYARAGEMKRLERLLNRPLMSQEQHERLQAAAEARAAADGDKGNG
ncbi:MAG: bL35 family ribosomal protein [Planctomycetota bacterium]